MDSVCLFKKMEEEDPQLATFQVQYTAAWNAAGRPMRAAVEEVLEAAFSSDPPYDVCLRPLWVFMKDHIDAQNTPINWFMTEFDILLANTTDEALQKAMIENVRTQLRQIQSDD